ncbi:MAG: hypothetical protein QOE90_1786 [Thermoplasmata archaeon]|jgi:malonyl CoA-acyl carrier protein transacylase|nr:hypothetical protein [Thermoplasmata archaeon]
MKLYVVTPNGNPDFAVKVAAAGGLPLMFADDAVVDGHPVARGQTSAQTLAEVKRLVSLGQQPLAQGGLDRATLKAVAEAGAAGVILDAQLWLLPESPLSADDKAAMARLGANDFAGGSATLPSGLKVGRDALLAPFLAKRAGSLAGAIAQVRSDLGAPSLPPPPSASPSLPPPPPPAPVPAPAAAPAAPPAPAASGAKREEVLNEAAASSGSSPATRAAVLAKVIDLVAQKTGYPKDLLDPGLDMEADLGIDTVKQAEIFGILRESYQLPRDDKLTLKDIPTLEKVADYLAGRMGAAPTPSLPPPPSASPSIPSPPPREAMPDPRMAEPPAAPIGHTRLNAEPVTAPRFETVPHEEAVAIIGVGAVLPRANNAGEFWQNVLNKVDCIVEVPADRWDASVHYDPDPTKEDKTYAKIGGFITGFRFDALKFRIPPNTAKALDPVQQMALTAAAEALADAGYDRKPFDRQRCAVILGNSLGGEMKDETSKRMHAAEFAAALRKSMPAADVDRALAQFKATLPTITEDSMPGELSNVIAGRLANVLNLTGKNLTTDAACASSHAALDTAVKAILGGEADMVLCGGADRSMDPATYVKFCKIGALSPTGSTPFDARANGFVMGEGVAILLLKKLSHAVRDGDRIYCVIRGMGSSSDGKGKGITAPNPDGQKLAVKRAFQVAEVQPKHVQLVEAHGTSTKVGDVVEVESIAEVFGPLPSQSVALGSVKSQIGHLKSAAGAAGMLKAALALHHKTLPPSINFQTPNPNIDWSKVPFKVQTSAEPWPKTPTGEPRRAAVSAFGFGGTNFHVILEEFLPEYHAAKPKPAAAPLQARAPAALAPQIEGEVVVLAADSVEGLAAEAKAAVAQVKAAATLEQAARHVRTPRAHTRSVRLGLGAQDRAGLAAALEAAAPLILDPKGRQALPLKVKGAAFAEGRPTGKVAFLFPGQGSQYANMCRELAMRYPVVRATFDEADRVLEPLLGSKLTTLLWVDPKDAAAVARAEESLKQTEVTQPAMLAADVAIFRLLAEHGIKPDMVGGHSLGEYAALVAAGVLSFEDALLAVSARGKEMAGVQVPDKGLMASVSAGPEQVEQVLRQVPGYVVAANKNCPVQTVIAGETPAVQKAMQVAKSMGIDVMQLNVSAAFHTSIVAPAAQPLRRVLDRLGFQAPRIPCYTNIDATLYPASPDAIRDILSKQIAAPVEWIAELKAMQAAGATIFVEVGPKRALSGFVEATLGQAVLAVTTNHPKRGDLASFLDSVAKLGAVGFELSLPSGDATEAMPQAAAPRPTQVVGPTDGSYEAFRTSVQPMLDAALKSSFDGFQRELARLKEAEGAFSRYGLLPVDVVVSGAAAGLPGSAKRIFGDDNFEALFRGENRIDRLDTQWAGKFLDKEIVRLVKGEGEPRMEPVKDASEVLKLAGRKGGLDMERDYAVDPKLLKTLDITSKLAIAAAYEALRDAGIPMVQEMKRTTTGKILPGDWVLPPHMQDDTGIIFASAFPGYDNFVQEVSRHLARRYAKATLTELDALYHELLDAVPVEKKSRISAFYAKHAHELHELAGDEDGVAAFNRHFLFSILSLGHAELAETIVARGPNTQVNAACSSSTQAIAIAEDWMRTGRARRVVVVGADDVTSENLLEWIGSGFLVSGAATTAGSVEEGALPFDRRRHGMIIGMGAVGLVLERREDVEARGMTPVARLVATRIANSAYHGSRLHVEHIAKEAKALVDAAARRLNLAVDALGQDTIFVSHETYTPARGGSASAEAAAMRAAFGSGATKVLVTNTKGFTGHPMGAGIEDALAVKSLQYGKVPPIANLRDVDPEFADLNLSRGGAHQRRFAMRFSAGFGSQLAMAFFERMAQGDARVADATRYQSFLDQCVGGSGAKTAMQGRVLRVTGNATVAPAPPVSVPVQTEAPKPAPASPVAGVPREAVVQKVMGLVAEKTGYPPEMLDPNLDMEADLGIDTVKQAEIFGILRESYGLPRDDKLTLKDIPTLAKVADYLVSRMSGTPTVAEAMAPTPPVPFTAPPAQFAPNPAAPQPAPAPQKGPGAAHDVLSKVVALVAQKTGYPPEMLDPNLDMEADLGIDTVKQAEIFGELREAFGIPRIEGVNLKDYPTMSHVAGFISTHAGRATAAQTAASAAPLDTARVNAPATALVRRVPRVSPAHAEGSATRSAFVAGHGALAEALRHKWPHAQGDIAIFSGPARELFLFARSRANDLDNGRLGLLVVTEMGGHSGIDHAAHPEQGGLTGMAKALAAEFPKAWVRALDLDPAEDVARRVHHVEAELRVERSLVEVGRSARGRVVVRTIEAGTTDGQHPKLPAGAVLLVTGGARGITAEALKALAPQKPTLVLLGRTAPPTGEAFDETRAKEQAMADLKAAGERVTPVAIEKRVAPLRAKAEIARNLAELRALGATAEYVQADASDVAALERAVHDVRARFGRIHGVIHAAGLEESKRLADKDEGAFDRAWKPKAEAAFALARLLEKEPPAFFVMFGSVAGRYGNAAQADYSAANDAISKLARALRAKGVGASVFAWGPWGEVGMATKGSTLTVLKAAGVEPITTAEGVSAFLSELARLDEPEVVLAKGLGQLEAQPHEEPVGQPAGSTQTLRATDPALDDHRVEGVPYLAGVLGMSAMTSASPTPVPAMEDVHFAYPVKLLRDQPVDITVHVESGGRASVTSVPPGPLRQPRTHFTARLLGTAAPRPAPWSAAGHPWSAERVYPPFFHGPAFQVLSRPTRAASDGIECAGRAPAEGIPPAAALMEGAFQALGLWGLAVGGVMALPERVGRVDLFGPFEPGRATYRVAHARLEDNRVKGDVQCIVDGEVAIAMQGVALIVTGPAALPGIAPWLHDVVHVGGTNVTRVGVETARALLERPGLWSGVLSPDEQAALSALPVTKRKEDWLAATLAAKAALRAAGDARPWSQMPILRGPDGAPLAHGARGITLSHAGGAGAAALYDVDRERVGIDLEVVEPRASAFEDEAFTPEERAGFPAGHARPAALALAWAAKEAVLKALGAGLSLPLHEIRLHAAGGQVQVELRGAAKERFAAMQGEGISIEARREGDRVLASARLTLAKR